MRTSVIRFRFLFAGRHPRADAAREGDEHPPIPVPEPEPPTPEPGEPPPQLRSVPPPEPEREPEPVEATAPEPVVRLPLDGVEPREWNVWELERLAQAAGGGDPARDEELAFLLLELRQFANADGQLAVDFD